jgi:hypothetical protein
MKPLLEQDDEVPLLIYQNAVDMSPFREFFLVLCPPILFFRA